MLGVVAQETTLDLELTVRENLLVFARYFAIPRDEAARRADELLELMALGDRRDDAVDRLSGGHAPAPADRPRADQPPAPGAAGRADHGPRPPGPPRRLGAAAAAAQRGATLVLTTHYMDEAAQLCDRLVMMDHGRIVRTGTPAGLVEAEAGREVLEVRVAPADADRGAGGRRRRCARPRGRRRPADPVRRRRRGPPRAHPRGRGRRGAAGAPGRPGWRTSSCASPGATCATRRSRAARRRGRRRRRPRLARPQRRAAEALAPGAIPRA